MLVLLTLVVVHVASSLSGALVQCRRTGSTHVHRQGSKVMRGVKLGPDTRHNPRGTRGGGGWVCFFKIIKRSAISCLQSADRK